MGTYRKRPDGRPLAKYVLHQPARPWCSNLALRSQVLCSARGKALDLGAAPCTMCRHWCGHVPGSTGRAERTRSGTGQGLPINCTYLALPALLHTLWMAITLTYTLTTQTALLVTHRQPSQGGCQHATHPCDGILGSIVSIKTVAANDGWLGCPTMPLLAHCDSHIDLPCVQPNPPPHSPPFLSRLPGTGR